MSTKPLSLHPTPSSGSPLAPCELQVLALILRLSPKKPQLFRASLGLGFRSCSGLLWVAYAFGVGRFRASFQGSARLLEGFRGLGVWGLGLD